MGWRGDGGSPILPGENFTVVDEIVQSQSVQLFDDFLREGGFRGLSSYRKDTDCQFDDKSEERRKRSTLTSFSLIKALKTLSACSP